MSTSYDSRSRTSRLYALGQIDALKKDKALNQKHLSLVMETCVCGDMPITKNQDRLVKMILIDAEELILQVRSSRCAVSECLHVHEHAQKMRANLHMRALKEEQTHVHSRMHIYTRTRVHTRAHKEIHTRTPLAVCRILEL